MSKYRLLIADEQPEWLSFSETVLEQSGYRVVLARSARDLLEQVDDNGYDLILVNAQLMKGEFGEGVHRLLQLNLDKAFIVVSVPSSVYQAIEDCRVAFKSGAKDCVDKPFSAEKLLNLVRTLLAEFVDRDAEKQGVQA